MSLDPEIVGRLATDRLLWGDFLALCDCGGRLAGTTSERRALDWLARRGAEATGRPATIVPVTYGGWAATAARLTILGEPAIEVPCHPLVRTRASDGDGLVAEVVDLGRGTEAEFDAHAAALAGRVALVRHEFMFATGHIHRRRKYEWARARGAVGFLIAGPADALVTGSSGRFGVDGVPAAGISSITATRLAPVGDRRARIRLAIETREAPATTETILFDLPGRTDHWVVLSAHLDGHDLAESAIDNATGVAVALAVARALAPAVAGFRRGVRLAVFSVEEWALTGSRLYVDALGEAERARIALDVNLDSVGGSPDLTALTSEFPALDAFLRPIAAAVGQPLGLYRPLMQNSDHANFARAGIPALRLVAGFDAPASNLRHVLTPADTRDKVVPAELAAAALLTAAIVAAACDAPDDAMQRLRVRG